MPVVSQVTSRELIKCCMKKSNMASGPLDCIASLREATF